jgi:hypothetical protein
VSLTALDRLEIAELVARFSHGSDYGDWEALAACFTPDVVTEIAGAPTYVGLAAQIEHARNSQQWTQGQNRHAAFNLWIEAASADAACAHYFLLNFVAGASPGDPKLVVSGRMTDHVVRTPAGWRIARREFRPDQPFPVPDANADAR